MWGESQALTFRPKDAQDQSRWILPFEKPSCGGDTVGGETSQKETQGTRSLEEENGQNRIEFTAISRPSKK